MKYDYFELEAGFQLERHPDDDEIESITRAGFFPKPSWDRKRMDEMVAILSGDAL